ncbi:hypothetical protein B0H13DRAFT_2373557 [Mycena leptocephala]|nr:hypothetical protein B0H13DRAFT_2373557 [Mycena leptocephala]
MGPAATVLALPHSPPFTPLPTALKAYQATGSDAPTYTISHGALRQSLRPLWATGSDAPRIPSLMVLSASRCAPLGPPHHFSPPILPAFRAASHRSQSYQATGSDAPTYTVSHGAFCQSLRPLWSRRDCFSPADTPRLSRRTLALPAPIRPQGVTLHI